MTRLVGRWTWLSAALMLMIAVPAFAIAPRLHVTVVAPLHEPWLGIAEPKTGPDGNWSVTATFVAGDGPLFVTTIR